MAEEAVTDTPEPETGEGVRRRDFINIAAISAAGIGGIATLVPLISQMAPSADVLAALIRRGRHFRDRARAGDQGDFSQAAGLHP